MKWDTAQQFPRMCHRAVPVGKHHAMTHGAEAPHISSRKFCRIVQISSNGADWASLINELNKVKQILWEREFFRVLKDPIARRHVTYDSGNISDAFPVATPFALSLVIPTLSLHRIPDSLRPSNSQSFHLPAFWHYPLA